MHVNVYIFFEFSLTKAGTMGRPASCRCDIMKCKSETVQAVHKYWSCEVNCCPSILPINTGLIMNIDCSKALTAYILARKSIQIAETDSFALEFSIFQLRLGSTLSFTFGNTNSYKRLQFNHCLFRFGRSNGGYRCSIRGTSFLRLFIAVNLQFLRSSNRARVTRGRRDVGFN